MLTEVPMLLVPTVLAALRARRSVFHSEADFQHALAWEIHHQNPQVSVRLERPILLHDRPIYLDLHVTEGSLLVAIELKYKTRPLDVTVDGEAFHLLGHAAQDLGRYDFLKDVQRLEAVVLDHPNTIGYAILLTNDSTYWGPPHNAGSIDAAFRLTEGRTVHGTLAWVSSASPGTTRGREQPIVLHGTYPIHWDVY